MKVYIGPHTNWIGPFQISNTLKIFGVSEEKCHDIGEWLADNTPLHKICNFIDKFKKRKIDVFIDNYDTWNCDSTLAIIILPLLIKFKELKISSAFVDDEDVPDNLKSTNAPPKKEEWDWDELSESRWDWVLSELIWTFEQLHPNNNWESDYHKGVIDFKFIPLENSDLSEMVKGPNDTHVFDEDGYKKHNDRIKNGLRLFGCYYQNLWD